MKKKLLTFIASGVLISIFLTACNTGSSTSKNKAESGLSANDVVIPANAPDFLSFDDDFLWGTATSAFQIEGGRFDPETGEELRGQSMWDRIAKTASGAHGDVASDQYHRYKEDVKLMAEAGMKVYRFSISWPRLFKDTSGYPVKGGTDWSTMKFVPELDDNGDYQPVAPNAIAVQYYRNLINELKYYDIEPIITLFHWDLPLMLYAFDGGFDSRFIVEMFQEYARATFKEFGHEVKYWTTLNEPSTYPLLIQGTKNIDKQGWILSKYDTKDKFGFDDYIGASLDRVHNYLLSHAKATSVFKEMRSTGDIRSDAEIGLTIDMGIAKPASDHPEDILATETYNEFKAGLFVYPVFQGRYPDKLFETFKNRNSDYVLHLSDEQLADDLAFMKNNSGDFVALNYYSRPVTSRATVDTSHAAGTTWGWALAQPDDGVFLDDIMVVDEGAEDTLMTNGEYDPQGLYDTLMWLYERSGNKPIIITEVGAGFVDGDPYGDVVTSNNRVHDYMRTRYLKGDIKACWQAMEDGVELFGFNVWSILDNFEWSFYNRRFGLIYVDFDNDLERIPKDSYYFMQSVIKNGGLDKVN
ncbi:MAG: family 1 glycosylhydrolase [Colwellia sp.]